MSRFGIVLSSQYFNIKFIGVIGDHFKSLCSDRSGGAKYGNSFLHLLKNDIISRIERSPIVPQFEMEVGSRGEFS